jgi:hypothetical protein
MVMKPNSNFKMKKDLKMSLGSMSGERKQDYKRAMISAIIAPRIEFKKKIKTETPDE